MHHDIKLRRLGSDDPVVKLSQCLFKLFFTFTEQHNSWHTIPTQSFDDHHRLRYTHLRMRPERTVHHFFLAPGIQKYHALICCPQEHAAWQVLRRCRAPARKHR